MHVPEIPQKCTKQQKKSIHVTGDTRTRQEEYGGVLRLLTTHPTFAVEFKLPDFLLQQS